MSENPDKPGGQVVRWADQAMFAAAPLTIGDEPVRPTVTLLDMTDNPLRVIASVNQMYRGDPVHDPRDISRGLALESFRGLTRTTLQAPLEWVDFSFLIEGVSRSFTHQMVRQRTAAFAQESMRFAVKENAAVEVVMPPAFSSLKDDDPMRVLWDEHVKRTAWVYNAFINGGIPAEDARFGLLIGTATRLHYNTNLRNLAEHAGYRLCSQAQQEWKQVWSEMVKAILAYGPDEERWQQREIVRLFKPICYQTGKCEFMAPTDRFCSIRERVEAHRRAGDPPNQWGDIDPHEPLLDGAARRA